MNAQTITGSQRLKQSRRRKGSGWVLTQEELRTHWPFDRLDPSRFPKEAKKPNKSTQPLKDYEESPL